MERPVIAVEGAGFLQPQVPWAFWTSRSQARTAGDRLSLIDGDGRHRDAAVLDFSPIGRHIPTTRAAQPNRITTPLISLTMESPGGQVEKRPGASDLNARIGPTMKKEIEAQFGAALDMLGNAIRACPESLWGDTSRHPQFWYLAYHTIFYVDVYLSVGDKNFQPPPPYTLSEFDPSGLMPDRVYTKAELLAYLDHGRRKFRGVMKGWNDKRAKERRSFGSIKGTLGEVLLYNLRHVQHHSAQLNLLLRQVTHSAPRWVLIPLTGTDLRLAICDSGCPL
jgi:hypothetical protein